jgi:hypothetical protein
MGIGGSASTEEEQCTTEQCQFHLKSPFLFTVQG